MRQILSWLATNASWKTATKLKLQHERDYRNNTQSEGRRYAGYAKMFGIRTLTLTRWAGNHPPESSVPSRWFSVKETDERWWTPVWHHLYPIASDLFCVEWTTYRAWQRTLSWSEQRDRRRLEIPWKNKNKIVQSAKGSCRTEELRSK